MIQTELFDFAKGDVLGVDLFAGCGGFSLGMQRAGIKVVGHVENAKEALATYEHNKPNFFPHSQLICEDITRISNEEIKTFEKSSGHINLVFGGPPCQSFSYSGRREIGDARDNLFLHFVRFCEVLQSDMFLLENVPGLLTKKSPEGKLMLDVIFQAFQDIGYSCEKALLNAVNYGVPQTRRRVFICGLREDKGKPRYPLPTHFGKGEGGLKYPSEHGIQYKKCDFCSRYYCSYVILNDSKKQCMFCYHTSKSPVQPDLGVKVQHLVLDKKVVIPAEPKDFWQISHIEERTVNGKTTRFLGCRQLEDHFHNWRWFLESEIRKVADDEKECSAAETFIYATLASCIAQTLEDKEVLD